jgi:rare lipoprotein A
MLRLPDGPARALSGFALIVTLIGLTPAEASAQETPAPQPVLDSAPRAVGFQKDAVIRGHLENGTPEDVVSLQRRRAYTGWKTVSRKTVGEDLEVRYRRTDLTRTTRFRLVWNDPVSDVRTISDVARVQVRSKLRFSTSPRHQFQGRRVSFSGRLFPVAPGRKVLIQRKVDGAWRSIKSVAVNDGRFSGSFEVNRKGFRRIRARFGGDEFSTRKRDSAHVTVYDKDLATWYGPGFYGNRTACGKTLTTETLGVAHRSLPCGTKVNLLYQGRTITVSVIDRGPYTSADWDLTQETAERLGFSGKDTVGTTR